MISLPPNVFKSAIASGSTQLGLWLSCASSYTAEIAAGADYDWLLIDGEHAPNDITTLLLQLQAIAPYRSHAVVRPVNSDPALIKQILDIGAQTLLVPMVDTEQQAKDLVLAMRYAPRGIRGVGASIARASRWGRVGDYLQAAEKELCLLVQVESRKGLENLDAIAQVEGVDGVFIGPADLSASMGYPGNAAHPDVQAAIENAIQCIRGHGKAAGILATDPVSAKRFIRCGANFVAIAVYTMLLTEALDKALDAVRPGNGKASAMPGSY